MPRGSSSDSGGSGFLRIASCSSGSESGSIRGSGPGSRSIYLSSFAGREWWVSFR